jgi:uncharacterized membrane protein YciS (DUF1049 family)
MANHRFLHGQSQISTWQSQISTSPYIIAKHRFLHGQTQISTLLPILFAVVVFALLTWMIWKKKKQAKHSTSSVRVVTNNKLPSPDGITDTGSDASNGDSAGETIEI